MRFKLNLFNKKSLLISLVLALPLLSGCSLSFTSSGIKLEGVGDGGIFMTESRGDSWAQVSAIPSVNGQVRSLGSEDIKDIAIDPNDHKSLYLATIGRGLWYTNSIKDGWSRVSSLEEREISSVQVDPESKCTVYVVSNNQILKTENCGRDYKLIYQDDNEGSILTTLVIDHYNHRNLYLGNSKGGILKSIDSGASWRLIKQLPDSAAITKILMSPQDSRKIFVATKGGQVYSFFSNTRTNPANSQEIEQNFAVDSWQDFSSIISSLGLGTYYRDFVISSDEQLFLAVDSSLARSKDGGVTWEKLTLLASDQISIINSIAIDPQNSKNIYYATDSTFFRSTDGGVSWSTKKLPSTRSASKLLIDYQKPSTIYLGLIKK